MEWEQYGPQSHKNQSQNELKRKLSTQARRKPIALVHWGRTDLEFYTRSEQDLLPSSTDVEALTSAWLEDYL